MSAYAFTALFTAVVSLFFGLWVLIIYPRRSTNQRWMIMTLAISIWSFSQFMREISGNLAMANFWGRYILYLGATMIPVTFTHFIIDYIGRKTLFRKYILIAIYFLAFLCLYGIFGTDIIISGMGPNPFFRYYVEPGSYYFLFLIYFGGTVILGFLFLGEGIKKSSGLKKDQLKIFLAGSLIGFIGGSTTFLPILQIDIFPFGNYFVSLYIFLISYGIFRHQWMDINIFLRKSLSGILAVLTFIIPTFLFMMLIENYFFEAVNPTFTLIVLTILVFSMMIFPRFHLKAEETLEHFLFPGRRDDRHTISRMSQEAVSILDMPKLLHNLIDTLSINLRVPKVAIMVLDELREQYRILDSIGYDEGFVERSGLALKSPLASYLQDRPVYVYRETELREIAEKELLEEAYEHFQAVLIIPLVIKKQLVGIIFMGEKENRRPYSLDDLELLRTLANQAAIAIENARLYDDLKKSRQYIRRADRLASLGTLAAGLAHEIRNPLVSVKTFLQLLPERFDDDDFRSHFLNIATDEVKRIQKLIDELLHFAKPSEPELQCSNLNEIVEKTLLLTENDFRSKKISLFKKYDAYLPDILCDKEQIKQVALNIILNAIQAMDEKGTMRIETRTIGLSGPKPSVQIEIYDDGPGISEDDMEFLFNPFFTTKHGGSGLGLAISHQIIKEHHGSIEVESTPNHGTTFFISLPLDPRAHERRKSKNE